MEQPRLKKCLYELNVEGKKEGKGTGIAAGFGTRVLLKLQLVRSSGWNLQDVPLLKTYRHRSKYAAFRGGSSILGHFKNVVDALRGLQTKSPIFMVASSILIYLLAVTVQDFLTSSSLSQNTSFLPPLRTAYWISWRTSVTCYTHDANDSQIYHPGSQTGVLTCSLRSR